MNTPTKQTVYLPVNGETEFIIAEYENGAYVQGIKETEGYFFTPEQLNEYTANVIKQALETAADRAEINDYDKHEQYSPHIDTTSITNTFEETFQKYKV